MSEFNTNLDSTVTKTLEETDKKCPRCGGVMNFDPATGGLSCPYCDYQEAIKGEEGWSEAADELDIREAENTENCNWGAEKKTILCNACGAEAIYDALQISAVCPFCGSNQVMEASDHRTMAPGGVVPFSISDSQASQLFINWIRKKWFCPKMAKESAKAKNFNGVYLPYWTFDADTVSDYHARYGIDKRVRNRKGEVKVVTDWYPTSGTYQEKFDDELVSATTNHNQIMLKGLEPYNTAANKRYQPEYVAGYVAERYAVGIKEAWNYAKQAMTDKLDSGIRKKVRYEKHADRVDGLRITTAYHNVTYKYLLLPVWISNYQYKNKIYHFMVNGQTGKVSGKTPISAVKVAFAIAAALAAAGIIYLLSTY